MKMLKEIMLPTSKTRVYSYQNLLFGIATEIGPRITYLALADQPDKNILGVLLEAGADTKDGFWHSYGGHRLWTSPEVTPRSYSLDNQPIQIIEENDRIILRGNPEPFNSIQKEIIISTGNPDGLKITHKIKNIGRWPIRLALWALTVMQPGGTALIPFFPKPEDSGNLLPDCPLVLWPYTDLTDSRLLLGKRWLGLHQEAGAKSPIKLGLRANPSIGFYHWQGLLFSKKTSIKQTSYPDYESTFETYTNGEMLELETLGPLTDLQPDAETVHTEIWNLKAVDPLPLNPTDWEPIIKQWI